MAKASLMAILKAQSSKQDYAKKGGIYDGLFAQKCRLE
jgi:hypothetical protein